MNRQYGLFWATALHLAAGAGLASDATTAPAGTTSKFTLNDIAWITGTWVSEGQGPPTTEIWQPPLGGSMVGMCRMGAERARSMYELNLIEEDDDGIVIHLRHFNPGLKARHEEPWSYRLVKLDGRRAVFENLTTDRHKRVIYSRPDDKTLVIRLEDDPGGRRTLEFALKAAG